MTDIFSPQKRSLIMAGVRTKNTAPEIVVKKMIRKLGFKFRSHFERLPGKPDIVLIEKRIAIFVHGCFWHSHMGCPKSRLPAANRKFWKAKMASNVSRDKRNYRLLKRLGWKVITVWECKVKSNKILSSLKRLVEKTA